MDNLTHSLIGLATSHSYLRRKARRDPKWVDRHWGTVSSISLIAGNLPDIGDLILDPLFSLTTGSYGISYLVFHRGYAHTVFGVLVLSALLLGVYGWLARKGKIAAWGAREVSFFSALTLIYALLHLFLDGWNNYGVHPFAPIYSEWMYGDTVFIIEPYLWLLLLGVTFPELRSKWARWVWGVLSAVAFAAPWLAQWIVPQGVAAVATGFGVLVYAMAFFMPRSRTRFFYAFLTLILGVFTIGSVFSRIAVLEKVRQLDPDSRIHDVIRTPMPANPLCWLFITVESTEEGTPRKYRLRRGVYAWNPDFFPVDRCSTRVEKSNVSGLGPIPPVSDRRIQWLDGFEANLSVLQSLTWRDCRVAALMRYYRAPFWEIRDDGSVYIGDLRYDWDSKQGFTEFLLPEEERYDCPRWFPGWIPPRQELLSTTPPGEG